MPFSVATAQDSVSRLICLSCQVLSQVRFVSVATVQDSVSQEVCFDVRSVIFILISNYHTQISNE